jgi:hypothetical protein
MGGKRLRCEARRLEAAAHAGNLNAAASRLAELQLQFERLKDAIQEEEDKLLGTQKKVGNLQPIGKMMMVVRPKVKGMDSSVRFD